MSIRYSVIEKVTIMDCTSLPLEAIDILAKEIDRIGLYVKENCFRCAIMSSSRNSQINLSIKCYNHDQLRQALHDYQNLSIYFNYEYNWPADLDEKEAPGFLLNHYFLSCEEDVFREMSFEFYYCTDNDDSTGTIMRYGLMADGTLFRGQPEYEVASEIPDAVWINNAVTASLSATDLSNDCDLDSINAAVGKLNFAEYYPQKRLDDFHDVNAEVIINQPKLENEDQRNIFFSALHEAKLATKGALCFNQPKFVDASTSNVRMLMLDMDAETGEVRYYLTKPI